MISFSERLKLEKYYKGYIEANPIVKECPLSVIIFLAGNGLLDEKRVKEYLLPDKIVIL